MKILLPLLAFSSALLHSVRAKPECKSPGETCGGQLGRCCDANSQCDAQGICTGCTCVPDNVAEVQYASCNSLGGGKPRRCEAKLSRFKGDNGGYVTVEITDLLNFVLGHAYTIWFSSNGDGARQLYNMGGFIFGHLDYQPPLKYLVPDAELGGNCPTMQTMEPSDTNACASLFPCDSVDLTNDLTEPCLNYDITDKCRIIFPLAEGCSRDNICNNDLAAGDDATGLKDARSDWIRLWFKDHGPHNNIFAGDQDQLLTFNGGCTESGIYYPKEGCPATTETDGGFECWDVANMEF